MSKEWVLQNQGRGLGAGGSGEGHPFFSVHPFVSFEFYTKFMVLLLKISFKMK